MLSAQQDPFSLARQQFDEKQAQPSAMPTATMFDQPAQAIGQAQAPEPSQPLSKLFTPASGQERQQFAKTSLPKALDGLGISNKNLALNDLGRMQLIGRLKMKFGDNYKDNPQALDVISMFEEQLKKQGPEAQDSLKAAISSGERTLGALLGKT